MTVDAYQPFRYDINHKVMIGDKQLTTQEAFKIFISFLKEYGYYGLFLGNMRKYYGTYYQMYRIHFICWSSFMVKRQEKHRRYHWYLDLALLFPFYKKKDFIPKYKFMEMLAFWEEYCKENKLLYSIIKEGEIPTYTDERGYTLREILAECDYPTYNKSWFY